MVPLSAVSCRPVGRDTYVMRYRGKRNTCASRTIQVTLGQRVAEGEQPGDRIRRLRKSRGWEQKDLAAEVGVKRGAVANWELHVSLPSAENLMKLGAAFGVSPTYIMEGEGGVYRMAFSDVAETVERWKARVASEAWDQHHPPGGNGDGPE